MLPVILIFALPFLNVNDHSNNGCSKPQPLTVGQNDVHVWRIASLDRYVWMKATLKGLGHDTISNQSGDDEKDAGAGFGIWNWSAQPNGNNHSVTFWIGGKEDGDKSAHDRPYKDLIPGLVPFELQMKNASWWIYALNEIAAMAFVEKVLLGTAGLGLFSWLVRFAKSKLEKPQKEEHEQVQTPKAPVIVVIQSPESSPQQSSQPPTPSSKPRRRFH